MREDGGDALLLPINIYPAQPPVDMGTSPPEWVTGAETTFTPGMDIYALGLALYILLTRKTPMEAGFAMPSSLIKCSDAVDSAVSRAINPDTGNATGTWGISSRIWIKPLPILREEMRPPSLRRHLPRPFRP